ncbi:MAG: DUF1611 domain-containing protein [Alphaproteobacteria bacterium]|nr:DUF1611 domain-containing protein [Alphaproteobacteria bacterium]
MEIAKPYLLFVGDAHDTLAAKTAFGLRDWRPEWCIGQLRLPGCKVTLDLPDLTPAAAVAMGARTMVLGLANAGGVVNPAWVPTIVAAIEAGMDVASGLHTWLDSVPAIAAAAAAHGRSLHDVRRPRQRFATGKGVRRRGRRLLTVGTDCSIGKNYAALSIEREMRRRGLDVDYRATGQTGILIAERGVPLDAVAADFVSGAVEWLAPENADDHWDIIEGQATLFHPSYAGLTLGLIHGAQPDAFVVCHEPGRPTMRGVVFPLPSIDAVIDAVTFAGRLTSPDIQCVGLSLNTSSLPEAEARRYLAELADRYVVPAVDPMRFDCGAIVDEMQRRF